MTPSPIAAAGRDPKIDPDAGDLLYGPGGWREVTGGFDGVVSYIGHRRPDGATVCLGTWRRWARSPGVKIEVRGPVVTIRAELRVDNPRAHGVIS